MLVIFQYFRSLLPETSRQIKVYYEIFFYLLCLLHFNTCFSQSDSKHNQPTKFFITAGYGIAGSFFVNSYEEFSPMPQSRIFQKKNFIGAAQNVALGLSLKKNWEVRLGLNYQHFTKWINSVDTLNGVQVVFDHDIHHRDYMWFAAADKKLNADHSLFLFGLGAYYLVSKTQTIGIYTRNVVSREQIWKGLDNGELGLFAEFAYEYKFQPKVNFGIKTQFYYTLTAAYAESFTLFPYIKIGF